MQTLRQKNKQPPAEQAGTGKLTFRANRGSHLAASEIVRNNLRKRKEGAVTKKVLIVSIAEV
jgi:hypothetical protein